jgi:hypothetical protein
MAPMVIDGGMGGLEQSFHHPEAGQNALNDNAAKEQRDHGKEASPRDGEKDLLRAVNEIVGLLDENKKKAGRRAIERYAQVLRDSFAAEERRSSDSNDASITKRDLKNLLDTVLRSRPNPPFTGQPPLVYSWAAIAAPATSSDEAWQPKMIVPARRAKELVIRNPGTEPLFRNRIPQEIVQIINITTNNSDAIAARMIRNGNIIIIFRNDADFKTQNTAWVTKAFGNSANISRRKLAVLVKGLSAKKLRNAHDKADLAKVFRQTNNQKITRCRRSLPRNEKNKYAAFVIHFSDAQAAQKLYSVGLL